VGHKKITTDMGTKDVLFIQLASPTKADKDGETITLSKGQIAALGVSFDLKDSLLYVENRGEVYVIPREQKKLKGGRKMWKFEQYYKGKKAPLANTEPARPSDDDDDDIPF